MTVGELGVEARHRLELRDRSGHVTLTEVRQSREQPGLDVVRIILQHGSQSRNRFVEPAGEDVEMRERERQWAVLATLPDCRFEDRDRLVVTVVTAV